MLSRREAGSAGAWGAKALAFLPLVLLLPAYVVAARLSLKFAVEHPSASPVWAPTGLAIAAFILLGNRVWPFIFIGAFVSNITVTSELWSSLGIAAGNTLEAALAAFLVNRYANGRFAFERAMDAARYVVHAAVLATLVSATIGVTSLEVLGLARPEQFGSIWLTWWLGNATGALVVAPPILAWAAVRRVEWNLARATEAGILFVLLLVICTSIFTNDHSGSSVAYAQPFLAIPALIWIAFRFYPRVATATTLAVSTIVLYGTLNNQGPFQSLGGVQPLIVAQAFTGVVAMTSLVLSSATYERMMSERAIRESENRFRALADSSPSMIWVADPTARWTFVNKTWLDFTRRALQELGTGWVESVHPEDLDGLIETYNSAFDEKRSFRADVRLRRADDQYRWVVMTGSPRVLSDGTFAGYVGTCLDISDRKKYELELEKEAYRDAMTGLPNRAFFLDRLRTALDTLEREPEKKFAVLFLDIDGLKLVNDTHGHLVGDQLIVESGHRIRDTLRPGDTVARLAGDEFAVLLQDVSEMRDAETVASGISRLFREPFRAGDDELFIGASIGIALATGSHSSAEEVLEDADAAMYRAKGRKKARQKTAPYRHIDTLRLETELRHALNSGLLEVYYQPIYEVRSGLFSGFETLVRWHHPLKGSLLPSEFISVAEDSGLISQIDCHVLQVACRQMAKWLEHHEAAHHATLSVNVSARVFTQIDLVETVDLALSEAGIKGDKLMIEVTESAFIDDLEPVVATLTELRKRGVRVVLDDFGTGYSSLSRLSQMPVDAIKIDRTFIAELSTSDDSRMVAKAVVDLAHRMNVAVTAEGVENQEEYNAVIELGCDYVQGHYFGRPASSVTAEELIRMGKLQNGHMAVVTDRISFRPLV